MGMPVTHIAGVPVAYRLVRTPRARRISIRVGPAGVTVTGPPRCSVARAERALLADADWLRDAMARIAVAPPAGPGTVLPLLDGSLTLARGEGSRTRCSGGVLHLAAGADPRDAAERWYRAQARRHLTALIDTWAPVIGVHPTGIRIAGQRARWGSASATGRISLNWRLMFAPARVGEYVVVHELCHLIHMDHSARFWGLVESHWPGHRGERRWLRDHGATVLAQLRVPTGVR